MYYDDLGRSLKTFTQHYLGGTVSVNNYDSDTTTYNFTNQPTTVTRKHWNTASTAHPLVTIANTYLYDQVGRKIKTWEQLTNGTSTPGPRTLVSLITYDEIGQVIAKHLHSTDSATYAQFVSYYYNERGWLQGSNAPLFAFALQYQQGTSKAYNGNIMFQLWGTPGSLTNYYQYTYDKLNRLLSGFSTANNNESLAYDKHGNITALNRYTSNTLTDQLTYSYSNGGNPTNQVQSIADATSSNTGLVAGTSTYTYDGNGNMLTQVNTTNTGQNKTFTYNLMDLPQTVTTAATTLTYTYDAIGNKLRKTSSATSNKTDHIAGIQYDGITTPTLSFIQTEEGKVVPNGTGYDYVYYLGDNLGNIRVTFGTKTGSAVVYQKDDYYPFGLEINNSLTGTKNEYLYNKQELQEETQEYDYGARMYDPIASRWWVADPMAETSRRWSPYNYVENNPIRITDVDGMAAADTNHMIRKFGNALSDDLDAANRNISKFIGSLVQDPLGTLDNIGDNISSGKAKDQIVKGVVKNIVKFATGNGDAKTEVAGTFAGELLQFGFFPEADMAKAGEISKAGEIEKILTGLAKDAKANVTAQTGLMEGKKGFGTAVHSEFKKLVDARNLDGVSTEQSYLNGNKVPYGTKNSVRADVVFSQYGSPISIFDLKTGRATLSSDQVGKYIQNVPGITSPAQITKLK